MIFSYLIIFILTWLFIIDQRNAYGKLCTSHNKCQTSHNRFCCRNAAVASPRICRSNCIGEYCASDYDCGGLKECCNTSSNRCTTNSCPPICTMNNDCKNGLLCCQKGSRKICIRSCSKEYCQPNIYCGQKMDCCNPSNNCINNDCRDECKSNNDCSNSMVCCVKPRRLDKNICKSSCLGEVCLTDNDCGDKQLCCNLNLCSDSCSSNWRVLIIVLTVCFSFLLIGVLFYFLYKRHRRRIQGTSVKYSVSNQSVLTTKTNTAVESKSQILNSGRSTLLSHGKPEIVFLSRVEDEVPPEIPPRKRAAKERRKPPSPPVKRSTPKSRNSEEEESFISHKSTYGEHSSLPRSSASSSLHATTPPTSLLATALPRHRPVPLPRTIK